MQGAGGGGSECRCLENDSWDLGLPRDLNPPRMMLTAGR